MGGRGSGRWHRWDRAITVDEYKTIDIRQWAKKAGLVNKTFNAEWALAGETTCRIGVQTSPGLVQVSYTHSSQYREQRISITYTSCHFGRSRPWFCCPGCARRCAILCLGESGFFCRKCYRLLYRSQTSSKLDRLFQQRTEMEERMYGDEGWFRRGIHCKTRRRLMARYAALEDKIASELGLL